MTTTVSGGGGSKYPGVTSNGDNGLNLVGDASVRNETINGTLLVNPNAPTFSAVHEVDQIGGGDGGSNVTGFFLFRDASGGTKLTRAMFTLQNNDAASVAPFIQFFSQSGNGDIVLAAGGGIGVYSVEPPTTQPLLATGAGHTVDNVITLLQSFGFCKQA